MPITQNKINGIKNDKMYKKHSYPKTPKTQNNVMKQKTHTHSRKNKTIILLKGHPANVERHSSLEM
jgi:hypothetical protein